MAFFHHAPVEKHAADWPLGSGLSPKAIVQTMVVHAGIGWYCPFYPLPCGGWRVGYLPLFLDPFVPDSVSEAESCLYTHADRGVGVFWFGVQLGPTWSKCEN